MIEKRDIRSEVRGQVFQRGQLIFQCQGVKDVKITTEKDEEDYDITHIMGRVRGSSRNFYDVSLSADEDYKEIVDYKCECVAYHTYQGMCKHCVALALQYMEIRDAGHVKLFSEPVNSMRSLRGVKLTDPELGRILQRYSLKTKIPFLQPSELGKVRLEPVLHMGQVDINLEFRIGIQRMYILKNISRMVQNVHHMEEVSYGKELQFVHDIRAFTPDSQKMLRYIMQQSETLDSWSGGFERTMIMTPERFESFQKAVGNKTFEGSVHGEREQNWRFVEEAPSRKLTVVGEEQGIRMEMEPMIKYAGANYVYYFKGGLIYRMERVQEEEIREFESYMNSWRGLQNYVSNDELPLFVRNLLPILEKYYQVEVDHFDTSLYEPEEVEFQLYLDAPQRDMITCDLTAVYGEEVYHVFAGVEEYSKRDTLKEIEVGTLVCNYCNAYDDEGKLEVVINDDEKMYEFLTEGIPRFQEVSKVFISDRLKKFRVISSPKATLGISLSGGLLEFTLESGDLSMEQMIFLLSKYDRKKRFYRLKNGEFVDQQDEKLAALSILKKELQISDKDMKKGTVTLPKYRALYLDASMEELTGIPIHTNQDFRTLIHNIKRVEDSEFKLPAELDGILREYQKKGFLWLKTLKQNGFGGILADDMGLGKTLQVIAFLLSEYKEKESEITRSLVICPASLVYNWKSECTQFAPELPVSMVVGNAMERKDLILSAGKREVLITSYDLLKRDIEYYRETYFANEIIDEAQYIKNHATQASKAVKRVDSGFRVALTGTPVENRLSELWSIFEYLMPGYLYSYQRFREEIEIPVVQNQEEEALKRLHKMIRPFVLRRLKKDVLKDLPEKLEKNIYARMEGEQEQIYQAHVQNLQMMLSGQTGEEFDKSRMLILAELTKLRQICCDPALLLEGYHQGSAKLDLCLDLVENAVEGGHKILLFSQFTTMLDRICKGLRRREISHYLLTGATSKEERMQLVQSFDQDDTSVFCISLKAGGTGLNLTAADIVIHFDPWWNTAVQNQATDRAHRIGQQNTVMVYRLIAKDTIEEKIVQLQDKKQMLAEQVLGGEGIQSSAFTKEELIKLLEF
ncbi:MAG TPA: SNF2 helicase associated domain-containing protein [Candidatus Pelethocola excrementipullorum]|nr:SNF2 helicase associated domain-containing protein [Candidatus Pelethocola excrementipullorum]